MSHTHDSIDESRCPLCGGDNVCGHLAGQEPGTCWCSRTRIPQAALERIPPSKRRQACVCRACAETAATKTNET